MGMATRLGYRLISFLLAGLVAYVVAVLFYTQINLSNLTDLGIDISLSDRLGAASHDLLSMTGMYLPIMLVALLVAFSLAAIVIRFLPNLRILGFVVAGIVGVLALVLFFSSFLGTNPIAVTRSSLGLLSQCGAGGMGGLVYALVSQRLLNYQS